MNWRATMSALMCIGLTCCGAEKMLPPHESLLPGDYVAAVGASSGEKATIEKVVVAGELGFDQALRITNLKRMKNFYDLQVTVRSPQAVKKGDLLLARFYARGHAPKNESNEADCRVFFQKQSPNWEKSLSTRFSVADAWQRFDYPFKVTRNYGSEETALCFGTGFNEQWIEIGGVELLRFGKGVKPYQLPTTPITYKGSAPDAPWRAQAAARIDQHRKGALVVRVMGAGGEPVPGADVQIEMKKHTFQFSSIISVPTIAEDTADARKYKEKVLELFNASGNENALKWPPWESAWGDRFTQEKTIAAFKWLKDNGLHARGHVMVWPSWKHLPKSVQKLKDNPERVPSIVREHIIDIATKMKPYVDEWDVINETRTNHDLMDLFGQEIMVEWFKTARECLPDTPLFINDYAILNGKGPGSRNHEAYKKTIRFLLDKGAPVTGIGFQSHIGTHLQNPQKVVEILEDFAEFELAMRITEFDINIPQEEAQGHYTRDFMTAVFSHPGVVGFQMWGFWEGRHWKPAGAMYRKNWDEKPNGAAYRDLVFREWWTQEKGKTDTKGAFTTRGFLGDYEVTVSAGEHRQVVPVSLARNSGPVTVTLK